MVEEAVPAVVEEAVPEVEEWLPAGPEVVEEPPTDVDDVKN